MRLDAKLGEFSPSGHSGQLSIEGKNDEKPDISYIKPDEIETGGNSYDRTTHPKLFVVIDQLVDHPELRNLSARKLETALVEFDVKKSWCAVAKKYWKETYLQ